MGQLTEFQAGPNPILLKCQVWQPIAVLWAKSRTGEWVSYNGYERYHVDRHILYCRDCCGDYPITPTYIEWL